MHLRACCAAGMGLPGEWGAPQRRWLITLSPILPWSNSPKSPVWPGQPAVIQAVIPIRQRPFYVATFRRAPIGSTRCRKSPQERGPTDIRETEAEDGQGPAAIET